MDLTLADAEQHDEMVDGAAARLGSSLTHSRLQETALTDELLQAQYDYLDSISRYCEDNKIELLFLQSPVRAGIASQLSHEKTEIQDKHVARLRKTLSSHQHKFVNAGDTLWSDTLFTDAIHLNENGARLFTKYCFQKIHMK